MASIAFSVTSLLSDIPISPIALIILLVFVGELLLGLEFFVIPGFGAGGILGGIALISAAVVAGSTYGVMWGVVVFLFSAVLSFAGLLLGMKTSLIKKRFVLSTVQKQGQGTGAEDLSELTGQKGTAITALRPAGAAKIADRRVDVISEGGYIETGAPIVVTLVEGPRVVVKEVKKE